jgi:SWI/SNF-related matrix-associated actin-dependent regulator 1 of chromatin subfamily A
MRVKRAFSSAIRPVKEKVYFFIPYNESIISLFKQHKLRWSPEYRAWYLDLNYFSSVENFIESNSQILNLYPEEEIIYLTQYLKDYYHKLNNVIELSRKADTNFPVPAPQGLSYYPYQRAGVEFLVRKKNVLLADSMGLGKSIQTAGYFNWLLKQKIYPKALVICPASVKYNWLKELNKWLIEPLKIEVVEGKNGFTQETAVHIYILNYDILKDKHFYNLNCIVLDEAHYIKNPEAQRTKEVVRICRSNPHAKIIALTGTPMLNRPVELFPILNLLYPERFNDFFKFAFRYCAAHRKEIPTKQGIKKVWDFSGASNVEELGRILRSTVMLRREKKDVLRELPDKIRTVVPVKQTVSNSFLSLEERTKNAINQIQEINKKIKQIKKENNKELLQQLKAEKLRIRSVALPLINEYRRMAFEEKKDVIVQFLEDTLNNEKVVVFTHHRDVANFFGKTFYHLNPPVLTGETSARDRQAMVEYFQSGKSPLFIATIMAAAEGITLTEASTVVFAEYEWTPAKMLQAEDRLHRIGQKNTVNSYWFALVNSIDEMFINKIVEKLEIQKSVMMDNESEEIFMMV